MNQNDLTHIHTSPLRYLVRFGLLRVVLACLLLLPIPLLGREVVKIGVLAFRPKPQTLAQWQPLALALKQALPSHDFVVEAFTYPEMDEAVAQHRVDFVLTNPGHYVMLAEGGGVSAPLATLAIKEAGQRTSFLGGVIFSRVGQTAIATLKDLRGKTIATPSTESLGGYQAQAFELSQLGIMLHRDCKLITTGMPHDSVVEAVLSGRAEVGFVRSGLLESMARKGQVDLQQIKIINVQNPANFPVQVSTRLYPEWAFTSLPHVDEELARHVASALLLWEENPAAKTAMGIHGFSVPANYGSVEALLRELRLPPFEASPAFTFKDIWTRYRWQINGGLLVSGLFTWLLIRLQVSNRKLASEQRLVRLHQEQLQVREETFRTVADYTYDWELWEGPGGALLYSSPSCERITGFSPTSFTSDPGLLERLLHPEDRANWQAHQARVHADKEAAALMSGEEFEFRLLRQDGAVCWIGHICHPIHDAAGVFRGHRISNRDITERKQAQAVLQASEAKYRTLIDNLSSGLVVHGPDSSILLANGMASALLGLSKKQMLGKTAVDPEWRFLQEDGSPLPLEGYPVNRVLASGEGFKGQVLGVCRPDRAAPTWVLGNAYAVKDAAGQIAEVVITFGDITALKQAEAALRESEERWKFAIEGAGDGLWDWNVQTGKAYYSPRYKEMYGYNEADFGTSSDEWSKRIHPDDAPGVFATLQPYMEGMPGCVTVEFRMLCKDGSWRWTLGRGMVVQHDDDGKPLRMIGTNSDITERRQAEVERVNLQNQLLHSQKMESLGTLAGGVAHDMNNVLGAILGLASAHIGTQPHGSPLHQALDTICKATERGGKMVKSLLSFARQSPAENNKLDMNAILREQINLLERTTLAKVRLVVDLEAQLRPILGDSNALTHAFMNLCVNAVDAMPETGTLTLHTRNVDNDWIEVMVEDNGMGMSKEVLEKAMEPFFTTKETGKGTGLGLSMVFSTVKAHRGQMAIESEPGQGTRVRLRFPACEKDAPVQAAATAGHEADQIPHGTLNVLLIDDDDLIQSSVQIILDALGHTAVTAAQSGEEGLALLQAGLEPDLVILDMNMPGLGGIGTLPLLRRLRPEVPVLLSTGRADQSALALASAYPGVTLLSKPFGLRELQKHLELIGLG